MRSVIKLGETLKSVAAVTFKEWAAYRSHMLLSLVIGPVFFLTQYYIWSAVYRQHALIAGFTFREMVAYFGMVTLLNYLIMDFADWNLQMLIGTGKFITFVLRPVSHRFFAFSQKVGHRLLGFFLEFIPVYILFLFLFKMPFIPARPLWFGLSLAFSFLIMFLCNYCVGMTGFWLVRSDGIRAFFRFFRDIFAGVFIPLSFFPGIVQKVLFFLPFQFITYVPVRVFIGTYQLADITMSIPAIVAFQGGVALLLLIVSEIIWRAGIKKFTAVGV